MAATVDMVNQPPHYTYGKIEVIDIIDALQLGYYEGQVVKYVARYKHKNGVQDLEKAEWYLNRFIDITERRIQRNNSLEVVDIINALKLRSYEEQIMQYLVKYKHSVDINDLKEVKHNLQLLIQDVKKQIMYKDEENRNVSTN